MIDWIHDKLKAWGRAKWRLINHSEGYPESIFGRIMEYGPGAGDHTRLEYFREGMTGDALEASLALFRAMHEKKMTDKQYEAVFVFYAIKNHDLKQKCRAMGISHQALYKRVKGAQSVLVEFFSEEVEECNPPVCYN